MKLQKILFISLMLVGLSALVLAIFPPSGNIAYYNFDETSGDLLDLVGSSDGELNDEGGNGEINRGVGFNGILNTAYNFTADLNGNEGGFINFTTPRTNCITGLACSVSIWVNTSQSSSRVVYYQGNHTINKGYFGIVSDGSNMIVRYQNTTDAGTTEQIQIAGGEFDNNYWQHIVAIVNSTSIGLYINGTFIGSELHNSTSKGYDTREYLGGRPGSTPGDLEDYWQGQMDEFGFWDRELTPAEVTGLWNSGAGASFSTGVNVTLNAPSSGSVFSIIDQITFNSTEGSPAGRNLSNGTIWIYNSTGILENSDTINITGISNETIWFRNISTLGTYNWNVFGCSTDTDTICKFAGTNNTFSINSFTVQAEDFNRNIFETDSENFEINITTLPSILNVDARLVYNNTIEKTVIPTCNSSGFCNIQAEIDIPLTTDEIQNKSFFWNITVFDGVTSFTSSTTEQQQNVTRVHLQTCDATYDELALNFTGWDERNVTRIDPFIFAGDFDYWLGGGSVRQNTSIPSASIPERKLCIFPFDRTLHTDALIDYKFNDENTTYVPRNYHLQNNSVSNASVQHIPLFMLDSESATTFILKVQDNTKIAIQNALILIQRFYPGEDVFRTVQIAKTDGNGESVGFYEVETVDYRHVIVQNNSVLLTTNPGKVVGQSVPFTLIFTVGEGATIPWTPFMNNTNIVTSLIYNETTELVTFSYVDTSGGSPAGRLLVERLSRSNSTSSTICDVSSTFASATLNCNMSGFSGTFHASGYVGNPSALSDLINFVISTAKDVFDKTGLFIGVFIILTGAMAFIFNPTVGIIAVNGALIFVNILGLMTLSPLFLFSIIGVSIILLILMKT